MAMKMVPTERRGVALDIGGHVGLWSRVLVSCFRKVIAFEPVPQLVECFRLNAPSAQLHEVAVSDYDGKLQMQIVDDNSGNFVVKVWEP